MAGRLIARTPEFPELKSLKDEGMRGDASLKDAFNLRIAYVVDDEKKSQ